MPLLRYVEYLIGAVKRLDLLRGQIQSVRVALHGLVACLVLLAKNTIGRELSGNRKLFVRVSRGRYLINPLIRIRARGEWVGIYDLLRIEFVAPGRVDPAHFRFDPNAWREDSMLRFERMLKGLAEQAREGRLDVDDAVRRSWLDPVKDGGAGA